ncbi:MAG: hypothetical protein K1060chlam2_00772 [Chlamydiae bacterium]|nr:hypothetical protein [Chlamydiota bacterium]
MKVRRLGRIALGIVSLFIFSSLGYAAADREVRILELENQMEQVGTDNTMGTYGANTATARPEVDGRGWFMTFDLLFWRTKIGGTEYAYSDKSPVARLQVKGRTKNMEFDWDWGLRAGLGYNFDYDGWDVRGEFTWWDGNGSDTTRAGEVSGIVPLRGSSFITNASGSSNDELFLFCTSAKSLFDVEYHAVDLELGRDYYVSGKLSFRPFWGVKSAWIDLEQVTRYTGGDDFLLQSGERVLGLQGNSVHIKEHCDFWGIGPRTGVDTRWFLSDRFSFYGNVSGALLWGYYDIDHKEKFSLVEDSRIHLHANRHGFSPTVRFQVGLRHDTYLNNDKQHLGVGIGFEGQYWWRQNQMLKINVSHDLKYDRYSEDLAFYGITADVKLDF